MADLSEIARSLTLALGQTHLYPIPQQFNIIMISALGEL
jgi:hypothetical protein